jgi:prepilin-type N-terminal cleavage/methylation domain-containing protein/prepilin-type processing-associated H-X9-DG protein
MTPSTRRRGFTLIELLVVIAIISVLIGLLVPAVQKVREASARTVCQNNLHQIALAAHDYQTANKHLPAGMDAQHVGVLVYLLPYMEEGNRFQNFSFRPSQYPHYYSDPLNRPLASSPPSDTIPRPPAVYGCEGTIKTFLCPSAPTLEETTTAIMAVCYIQPGVDYTPIAPSEGTPPSFNGYHLVSSAPGRLVMGRSHYLGVGGYFAPSRFPQYVGLFTYKVTNSLGKVPDGTSTTLMFLEMSGGAISALSGGGIPAGQLVPSWSCGFNYTGWSWDGTANGITFPNNFNNPNSGSWALFSSRHPNNILNAAYADGSVRTINPNIDYNVLQFVAGFKDGQIVTLED